MVGILASLCTMVVYLPPVYAPLYHPGYTTVLTTVAAALPDTEMLHEPVTGARAGSCTTNS